jgi:hypothetical protein
MTVKRNAWGGTTSADVAGFCGGGYIGGVTQTVIDKLTFATLANMTDHGDLIAKRRFCTGASDATHGYYFSTYLVGSEGGAGRYNEIWRFAFESNVTASDVGDLSATNLRGAGATDATNSYGYMMGGHDGSSHTDYVERFAQAASSSGADVGNLTVARGEPAGVSSPTEAFMAGGGEANISNVIDRFPFAASITSVDVGNLSNTRFENCGISGTDKGYSMGGMHPDGGSPVNIVDRWSTSSYGDAVDICNLSATGGYLGGEGSQQ